jgi:tetratricopeptide (TPR) repeat protein
MPEHALRELARLGEQAPRDGQACYLHGEALRALDRFSDAIPWLQAASDFLPDNIHVWLAIGWCYKRTGYVELAIDALETALAVESGEAIIYYNLACYWSLASNKRQALSYLARALDIDTNYRDLVHDEPDFDPLRDDPDFQSLTSVIV